MRQGRERERKFKKGERNRGTEGSRVREGERGRDRD